MADDTDQTPSPTPEELADLMARYKAAMSDIAIPVPNQNVPGSGVLLPQAPQTSQTSVPTSPAAQDKDDESDDSDDDTDQTSDSTPVDNEEDDTEIPVNSKTGISQDDNSTDDISPKNATPAPDQSDVQKLATSLSAQPSNQSNINQMLQDAIKQRNLKQALAGFEQAGNLIGAGLAGQHGAAVKLMPQDFYAPEYKNAEQPIEDFKAKMAIQGDDPNSEASQTARALGAKVGITFPPTATANSIHQALPVLATFQAKEDAVKQRAQASADKSQDRATTIQAAQIAAQSKKDDRTTDQQNKALTSAQQLLESARGNPAAAQAEKDLYSASKANSLANLYGDPNKLSLPQVKLLASEIGKIAAGGTSTQSELDGITPNTLTGKMSNYVSNLTNNPTPANAAAFVKQYQEYTQALVGDAKKVIQDKYGRVIETRKNQLGDDNYNALKDQYLNRFNGINASPSSKSSDSDDQSSGFNISDPKDLTAVQTIMQNNPGISQQDAINALVKHKKDQGY